MSKLIKYAGYDPTEQELPEDFVSEYEIEKENYPEIYDNSKWFNCSTRKKFKRNGIIGWNVKK